MRPATHGLGADAESIRHLRRGHEAGFLASGIVHTPKLQMHMRGTKHLDLLQSLQPLFIAVQAVLPPEEGS